MDRPEPGTTSAALLRRADRVHGRTTGYADCQLGSSGPIISVPTWNDYGEMIRFANGVSFVLTANTAHLEHPVQRFVDCPSDGISAAGGTRLDQRRWQEAARRSFRRLQAEWLGKGKRTRRVAQGTPDRKALSSTFVDRNGVNGRTAEPAVAARVGTGE